MFLLCQKLSSLGLALNANKYKKLQIQAKQVPCTFENAVDTVREESVPTVDNHT